MATKRMFSLKIVDTDAFTEMPNEAQLLYFRLCLAADDGGFVGSPRRVMRSYGIAEDSMKILIAKKFALVLKKDETVILLIKHWRMHNTLRKDRYTPTNFQEELSLLGIKDNGSYTRLPSGCQVVAERLPQVSIGKCSIDKVSLVEGSVVDDTAAATTEDEEEDMEDGQLKLIGGELGRNVVYLSDRQMGDLMDKLGFDAFNRYVDRLATFIIEKKAHVKSHYETILKWHREDTKVD